MSSVSTNLVDGDGQVTKVDLAEVTRSQLNRFARWRYALSVTRVVAWAVSVLVFALGFSVLLDGLWPSVLARWLASAFFYLVLFASGIYVCLRLFASRHLTDEARLIEAGMPELRDQLLNAVELAQGDQAIDGSSDAICKGTSVAFLEQLQQQVAAGIEALRPSRLLPPRVALTAVSVALISLTLIWAMCQVPGLHLKQRILRTLLPGSNLARVSSVEIQVVAPNPASALLPRGDIIAIRACLLGASPTEEVWLETRDASTQIRRTEMIRLEQFEQNTQVTESGLLFESTLEVDAAEVDYRVVSGAAHTAWYKLTTELRPQVEKFQISVEPPAYTEMISQRWSQVHGDVFVLKDSEISWTVHVNQAISESRMEWLELAETAQEDAFEVHSNNRLASFASRAEEDRSFRVALTAEATGFVNAFSDSYHLRVIPDSPPLVRFLNPSSREIAAGPEEILAWTCEISDEMPVAKMQHLVRRNGGDWRDSGWGTGWRESVQTDEGGSVPDWSWSQQFAWQVDLLELELEAGDVLESKLRVTDRKGQITESDLRSVTISPVSVDLRPSFAAEERLRLANELTRLSDEVSTYAMDENLTFAELRGLAGSIIDMYRGSAAQLVELQKRVAEASSDAASVPETRWVGEKLADLELQGISKLESLCRQSELSEAERISELTNSLTRFVRDIQELSRHVRSYVVHDEAVRHAELLRTIALAEQDLATATPSSVHESMRRQQTGLIRQMRSLRQDIVDSTSSLDTGSRRRYLEIGRQLSQFADTVEQRNAAKDNREFSELVSGYAESLSRMSRDVMNVDRLNEKQRKAWNWMSKNVPTVASFLRPNLTASDIAAHQRLLEQLEMRRSIRLRNPTDSGAFVKDLGQAKRAVEALLNLPADAARDKRERGIQEAVFVLELASELEDTAMILDQLYREERWELAEVGATTNRPRLWDAFLDHVDRVARRAQERTKTQVLSRYIDPLRWSDSARAARQRLDARRWNPQILSTTEPLRQLTDLMSELSEKMAPLVSEARELLDDAAPSLAELARNAAKETRELSQRTQHLGDAVEEISTSAMGQDLEQLQQDVAQVTGESMQDLREAIADRIGARDLLDSVELRRAQVEEAGLQVLDRAITQTQNSLADVASADPTQQESALKEAALEQSDASEALDQLAQILEAPIPDWEDPNQFENNMQVIESMATELNSEGQGLSANPSLEQAAELANIAERNPEQMLRVLEQELQAEQSMQSAMSEIAREIAEQAKENLMHAREQQAEMQDRIENSDPEVVALKSLMNQDLRRTQDQANHLLYGLREANRAANFGNDSDAAEAIQKAMDVLSQSLQSPVPKSSEAMREMQSYAQKMKQSLESTRTLLTEASESLVESRQDAPHRNGAELANRRRDMKNRQKRTVQYDRQRLQSTEKNLGVVVRQAASRKQQLRKRVDVERRNLEQAQQRLDKDQDSGSLQNSVRRHIATLGRAKQELSAQTEYHRELEDRYDVAKLATKTHAKQERSKLEGTNPGVEMALEVVTEDLPRLNLLQKTLDAWASFGDQSEVQASADQLRLSMSQQDAVRTEVQAAAGSLERAARHEARLGRLFPSDGLARVAQRVDGVATQEIVASESSLADALNEANQQTELRQSRAGATRRVQESGRAVEVGILQSVEALQEVLDAGAAPDTATKNTPATSPTAENAARAGPGELSSQSGSSKSSVEENGASKLASQQLSSLNSQQKARLLDELDQRVHDNLDLGQQDNNSQNPALATPASSTLAQAARRLAAQLRQSHTGEQPAASADFGAATEAPMANAKPQGPVTVQTSTVERVDGSWGELRQRRTEGTVETRRTRMAPHIREQVEAYFRALSEASEKD